MGGTLQARAVTLEGEHLLEPEGWEAGVDRADGAAPSTDQVAARVFGVVVGAVVGEGESAGSVLVHFPGNPFGRPVVARSVGVSHDLESGSAVALMFEQGDLSSPIIMGPIERIPAGTEPGCSRDELTLRCGKASITLTKSGKIILRGKYIVSRSEGVNRIKGGSVQIN